MEGGALDVEEKVTLAVLATELRNHVTGCTAESKGTNRRLGRIEGVLIAVAGATILQLLAVIGALAAFTLSLMLGHH